MVACGGGSSSGSSSDLSSLNSLSDLPDSSTMVATSSTSSVSANIATAVSGTPSLFTALTPEPHFFEDGFLTSVAA